MRKIIFFDGKPINNIGVDDAKWCLVFIEWHAI
jgi:hypothetical protein